MSVNVLNITGGILFWMQSMRNKEIAVYVDGKYAGNIKGYYSTGVPSCGADLSVTVSGLSEGTHSYTASEVNAIIPTKWGETFQVLGRECGKRKLIY